MTKDLIPIETVGLAAKLEEKGVSVGVRSRTFTALDALLGRVFEWARLDLDAKVIHERAKQDVGDALVRAQGALIEQKIASGEISLRAFDGMICDYAKRQINKDAIAIAFVDELLDDSVADDIENTSGSDEQQSIDEDWLNIFAGHAERTSTQRLRELWARVLAGEVRNPGAFSFSTLRFLSELDQKVAEKFEYASKYVIDGFILKPRECEGEEFVRFNSLSQRGLITGFEGSHSMTFVVGGEGKSYFAGEKWALKIEAAAETKLAVEVLLLTDVGLELTKLLPSPDELPNMKALASAMFNKKPMLKLPAFQPPALKISLCEIGDGQEDPDVVEVLHERLAGEWS